MRAHRAADAPLANEHIEKTEESTMNVSTDLEAAAVEGGVVHESHAAGRDEWQYTVLHLVQATPADGSLSSREHEVLRRIVAGDSNKMIARTLGLSPHTVKRHVANILDKLGARTRAQAAAWLLGHH
jgi:LuxR family maltose regulon positive regulatory protein